MPKTKNSSQIPYGLIIPSYKEEENIVRLIQALRGVVPMGKVFVVDDSPDRGTVQAIENFLNASPESRNFVHVTHRPEKGGRGSAVIEGIRLALEAGCQGILEMDADFSHPPEQIPELFAHAEGEKLDLLIASRYRSESRILNWPLSRRVFSKGANLLARTLLEVPVSDYTNGFRLYSRPAAEMIAKHCGRRGKGFIPLSEILVQVYYSGLRVGETPTIFTNRLRGESSLNFTEIKNAIVGLFRIHAMKKKLKSERVTDVKLAGGH